MVISQKFMQDKRVVMDFRYLNVRIAKNNLAYPLVRDTYSVLGNSKCEVLSVLDLKDVFHSLILWKIQRNIAEYYIFWKCIIHISEKAYGLEYLTIKLAILYKCNFRVPTE